MALALEASDDSTEEYERISALANREVWEGAISASDYQQANTIKILPALAIQALDISETGGRLYPISSAPQLASFDSRIQFVLPRIVDAQRIAAIPTLQDDETEVEPTIVNYTNTISLIRNRTIRHQYLVKRIALILDDNGYELSENPMDCLAKKEDEESILIDDGACFRHFNKTSHHIIAACI